MPDILIVDDDAKIARIVARYLEQAGYAVRLALNGAEAVRIMQTTENDLLVLDVLLPDTTGLAVCRALRRDASAGSWATRPDIPVLMLSALGLTDDVVDGLRSGADDYMVKPFEPRELVERIRALLRRRPAGPPPQAIIGDLGLDRPARLAVCQNQPLELTRREFDLLAWLVGHPGCVFSRGQLLDDVWGEDYDGGDRAVDLCVLRLRNRLRAAGCRGVRIDTVRGSGYRLICLQEKQP
ncbi:MAG TPA: DNA-binding response regulator [Clostridiales bacterium]|nr:DNA-binding response regulator [Clostridiales bacterium]